MSHNLPPDPGGFGMDLVSQAIPVVAGVIGAMVRSLTGPEKSWRQRAAAWIGGAAMALYATPVVAPIAFEAINDFDLVGDFATVTPQSLEGLCGFLLGAVGVTLVEALIGWARRVIDNFPWPPWAKKRD